MNDELKYCKFCDKEKPIKEFVKSGFAIKNICKECDNKKHREKRKASENWNELKKWVEEYEENSYGLGSYETGISDALGDVLKKMQELEGYYEKNTIEVSKQNI